MKAIQILPIFVSLFCLTFIVGCGDTEEASNSVNSIVSVQELPADDDIQGLYNLGIPRNWEKTEDPVLYTKYLRSKLLRKFGNVPEVHIVADMVLKERQSLYLTPDETIAYAKALYRLFPGQKMLTVLKHVQNQDAARSPQLHSRNGFGSALASLISLL